MSTRSAATLDPNTPNPNMRFSIYAECESLPTQAELEHVMAQVRKYLEDGPEGTSPIKDSSLKGTIYVESIDCSTEQDKEAFLKEAFARGAPKIRMVKEYRNRFHCSVEVAMDAVNRFLYSGASVEYHDP